jgi:biotin transport system substrate-specific component
MKNLRMSVFAALFTALIIVGAYLKIPIGPVPIVLANFFVILAGALLGPRWAASSVALYLLFGVVGLPVFAGGGGLAYLTGPTGGFLIGYLPAAVVTGLVSSRTKSSLIAVIGLITGSLTIYLFGVPWLAYSLKKTLIESISIGMLPFLIGDGIKIVGAFSIMILLMKRYPEFFLSRSDTVENDEPS